MPPKKSGAAASSSSSSAAASARSGLVLKGRCMLGQMLGEGACGQVFETTDVTGTQGEHAWVVKVTPLPAGGVAEGGKKKKLSKADEALKRNADTLYMEQLVYKNYLMGVPAVPALPLTLAYGEDQGFRFLVLQRLGQDLNQAFEASGKRWANATLADYGRQMLASLRRLHERQLVFIDVKPENFMLGLPSAGAREEAGTVFMVDFGLVEKYTGSAGGHKPMEGQGAAGGAAGTPLFSSLAVPGGKPPARRDDLEGLGLVLLFFARGGHLPWADATSDADCLAKKKGAALADLCRGVPGGDSLRAFIEQARALPFEAAPDYGAFDRLLLQLAKAKDAPGTAAAGAGGGGASGGAGRKRGAGGGAGGGGGAGASGDENGGGGGGGGGGGKKSRTASSSSSSSSAPAGKQQRGGGGGGRSSKPTDSSSASASTSPGGWLAKAAGAVLRGIVDLTTSPPPAPASSDAKPRKRKGPAGAAGGAGKRGRGGGGGKGAAASAAVMEIEESGSEGEEEEDEKENASVCSRASAAATLALEAIAGPHQGQRFELGVLGKKAVGLGSCSSGAGAGGVSLAKDRAVQAKHARLESTGREAVHSLKVVPAAGCQVLVNRVAVGKSGRTCFPGDVIEIGNTRLALRRA